MTSKPVLLLCGCRKYEEYLHAAIRRMSRPEWEVIGIIGGDQTAFDETTRILCLSVSDTYEALPIKLQAAYKWIYTERPGIPGIFKTDDDMLFDIPGLVTAVLANVRKPYWGVKASMCEAGRVKKQIIESRFEDKSLQPAHQSAVYCYGAGYWLSAEALPVVIAAPEYCDSALEDVCTGFVMNRAGWKPDRVRVRFEEAPRDAQLLALL